MRSLGNIYLIFFKSCKALFQKYAKSRQIKIGLCEAMTFCETFRKDIVRNKI